MRSKIVVVVVVVIQQNDNNSHGHARTHTQTDTLTLCCGHLAKLAENRFGIFPTRPRALNLTEYRRVVPYTRSKLRTKLLPSERTARGDDASVAD